MVYVPDLITCFKFGDDRLRGLASAEGQILPFDIDFDCRPYNTLTLPCECVIFTIAVGAVNIPRTVRVVVVEMYPFPVFITVPLM